MNFTTQKLSDRLVYIRWQRAATDEDALAFIWTLEALLNAATEPLFFISDLRQGYVTRVGVISEMGKLARHKNWGGGTSFSEKIGSSVYAGLFKQYAQRARRQDSIWSTLEDALTYLETLKPGVTADIDWQNVVDSTGNTAFT